MTIHADRSTAEAEAEAEADMERFVVGPNMECGMRGVYLCKWVVVRVSNQTLLTQDQVHWMAKEPTSIQGIEKESANTTVEKQPLLSIQVYTL
jgi:hypothetical protein